MNNIESIPYCSSDILKSELSKKQVFLDNGDLDNVLYDSSFQPLSNELREYNREMSLLGVNVILATYAIYLYKDKEICNSTIMTEKLKSCEGISRDFHDYFGIEKYVRKSKGEINGIHTNVSNSLIALIYRKQGLKAVYNVLKAFFYHKSLSEGINYKSIVQDYAQAKKIPFSYELIGESGPEHEKQFKSKLLIGVKSYIGTGKTIKESQKNAAKLYIEENNIVTIHSSAKDERSAFTPNMIDPKREKELLQARVVLRIKDNSLSLAWVDEALTHIDMLAKRKREIRNCNRCLSIVGTHVVNMFAMEYAFFDTNIPRGSMKRQELNKLVKTDNLSHNIPNAILDYVNGLPQNMNDAGINQIKVAVFKSVSGLLAINALVNDVDISRVRQFVTYWITVSCGEHEYDYVTFFHEVVQQYGGDYQYTVGVSSIGKEKNETVYCADLVVTLFNRKLYAKEYGKKKANAKNRAAKNILCQIMPYIDKNNDIWHRLIALVNPEEIVLQESIGENVPKLITVSNDVKKGVCPKNVVYVNRKYCQHNEHHQEFRTVIIDTLREKKVTMEVRYCLKCKQHFLWYDEYTYYKDQYGILLGAFIIDNTAQTDCHETIDVERRTVWADESLLRASGYTVNQQDGLTSEQRRLILDNIIKSGMLSKNRVMSYLSFFIRNSEKRASMAKANSLWKQDLNWLRHQNY